MGASWRKKMDEVEARIKKEQGNLGVLDGEVKLKTKEKEYLKIKLQRLVREQENLREGSALEELSKVVAEQAAKTELLKSSNLVLEQHGLEVVSERKASGALKRKAEAARTEAMTIADCRRPK
ncbi:uncharacterized protein CLAFUR5_05125 [Fulvia fulva]|uniref:Uncharacterized protein n=1 Tax=Passalora fulva TaxID=5499 RepID=A0A9Q8LEL5_PASFU|nr:uncharacterized protein CLAFUR5_05125 [Fulvia fulva]KAK4617105.1 hypothetical protein CLAFUR0_10519 [Fulvia fulva]UJO15979.1 hypothetical protein CLAFUR5_05125 [Fulvia fulva]